MKEIALQLLNHCNRIIKVFFFGLFCLLLPQKVVYGGLLFINYMMRKKNIKALKIKCSSMLFLLLCFFFVSYVDSQTFYADNSDIFIKEGTVLSLNKKPDSFIYIEQGTVISGVEYINNARIVYEKALLKEKEQHIRSKQVHKKEIVSKKKEYITEKPKITIRKNKNE
ncbi:hypothetical protein [Algoriella xinjiangensis]|uniref:hypothetical protein n=1 Tax=Algoriella xinjiangensis TaxID=684065 RepID=UPI000F63D6A3|nr:hypothetical protein [Algoriella xinjiangensis]